PEAAGRRAGPQRAQAVQLGVVLLRQAFALAFLVAQDRALGLHRPFIGGDARAQRLRHRLADRRESLALLCQALALGLQLAQPALGAFDLPAHAVLRLRAGLVVCGLVGV